MTQANDDILDVLRNDLEAGDGSFLIQTRVHLEWDREAFSRLTEAMLVYCEAHTGDETLERWVASGFYYLSFAVKDWTTHPNFPRPYPPEYYEKAYERLSDLGYYCLFGDSPYEARRGFEPL